MRENKNNDDGNAGKSLSGCKAWVIHPRLILVTANRPSE